MIKVKTLVKDAILRIKYMVIYSDLTVKTVIKECSLSSKHVKASQNKSTNSLISLCMEISIAH